MSATPSTKQSAWTTLRRFVRPRPAAERCELCGLTLAAEHPQMLSRGLEQFDPPRGSVVLIENVGNLVCPALFDLGERAKVVVASVAKRDDKPLKYPHMFRASELLILNKIALLAYVPFDVSRFIEHARQVNATLRVLELSATRGDGLGEWYDRLRERAADRIKCPP